MPHPTAEQRRRLFDSTKVYFDSFYTSISHLLSVTARFSGVFGQVNFTEIAPFIKTLEQATWGLVHHLGVAELEQARLFRAILNHPQQFPVIDWLTQSVEGRRELPFVVVFGEESRKGSIPSGATRSSLLAASGQSGMAWTFEAPDEVSVTNVVANVLSDRAIKIIATMEHGTSFSTFESRLRDARLRIWGHVPFDRPAPNETPDLGKLLPDGFKVAIHPTLHVDR